MQSARTQQINFVDEPEWHDRFKAAARAMGVSLADWLRMAARRQLAINSDQTKLLNPDT